VGGGWVGGGDSVVVVRGARQWAGHNFRLLLGTLLVCFKCISGGEGGEDGT